MTYVPTLNSLGKQPKYPAFDGQKWTAAMGSVWNPYMPHCVQFDGDRVRFELQNTPQDRGSSDPVTKRRTELANSAKAWNRRQFWEAATFRMQPWSDPAGMKAKLGGTASSIHQLKWPSGDSPAYAWRLTGDAFLRVTTRTDGTSNKDRYTGSTRLDDFQPRDLVSRCVLRNDPQGELDVWMQGSQIVRYRGPIGSAVKDGYRPSFGLYFPGGIACGIIIEMTNFVHLGAGDLSSRIASPMGWPS